MKMFFSAAVVLLGLVVESADSGPVSSLDPQAKLRSSMRVAYDNTDNVYDRLLFTAGQLSALRSKQSLGNSETEAGFLSMPKLSAEQLKRLIDRLSQSGLSEYRVLIAATAIYLWRNYFESSLDLKDSVSLDFIRNAIIHTAQSDWSPWSRDRKRLTLEWHAIRIGQSAITSIADLWEQAGPLIEASGERTSSQATRTVE